MAENLKKIYGIDLGTTYSCIACVDDSGEPAVSLNFEGERTTPSVVFFDGDGVIVGAEAKRVAKLNPKAVVEMVKRDMGNPNYLFEYDGKTYRAEEISAQILRKVVGDVCQATADSITEVVITCPAYFGINQREATAKAGEIAGLTVRQIINEPTAAAIYYVHKVTKGNLKQAPGEVILVYDLGGGTFDITMIGIARDSIDVICTGGDHELGGRNWDECVVRYLAERFQQETGSSEDILGDAQTCQDLFLDAEMVKKTLSVRDKAPLAVIHGGQRVQVELTRDKFDELTAHLLERTIQLTRQMLGEARQKGHTRFDRILLVGGATRMPQVTKRLQAEFDVELKMFEPDEAVGKGAALFGWRLALNDEIVTRIAEETGQDAKDVAIEGTAPSLVKKAQEEVAVTYGLSSSTVKAATEQKQANVTSKTFGLMIQERGRKEFKVCNLILRNDRVPADTTRIFGTVEANQSDVEVVCYENSELVELTEVSNSTEIGKFELPLPAGLRADSPIQVNFKLNAQGRLEVTATGPDGKTINGEIQTESVMSPAEVEDARRRALAMPQR